MIEVILYIFVAIVIMIVASIFIGVFSAVIAIAWDELKTIYITRLTPKNHQPDMSQVHFHYSDDIFYTEISLRNGEKWYKCLGDDEWILLKGE